MELGNHGFSHVILSYEITLVWLEQNFNWCNNSVPFVLAWCCNSKPGVSQERKFLFVYDAFLIDAVILDSL